MIRSLRPGEAVPAGPPRRYPNRSGYIRLRWTVAPNEQVEILEHRISGGRVLPREIHVHHRNGIKDDNRPENLVQLTNSEHGQHHARHAFDWDEAARMYEGGMSTPAIATALGVDASNVFRRLRDHGVRIRSPYEANVNRLDLNESAIVSWARLGLRQRQIAELLGLASAEPVARILKAHGVPPAKTGSPTKEQRRLFARIKAESL